MTVDIPLSGMEPRTDSLDGKSLMNAVLVGRLV